MTMSVWGNENEGREGMRDKDGWGEDVRDEGVKG